MNNTEEQQINSKTEQVPVEADATMKQEDEDISEEKPQDAEVVGSKSSSSKQGADGEEAVPKDDVEDEDVEYVDNEILEKMDEQEELYGDGEDSDDYKTIKDSEIDDEDQYKYMDGDIVKEYLYNENDSVC